MIRPVAFLLIGLLSACSSLPPVEYEVSTYQKISHSRLALADRNRQMEQYQQALDLYKQAETYAQKRNDKLTLGISRLKRAAIHIELKQQADALALINQVEKIQQYEAVGLNNPLMFIRAKLAYGEGDVDGAVILLAELEQTYIEQPERNIYYRMVRWVYQPDSVALAVIQQDVTTLGKLVAGHELSNIEIYSYALFNYAKWLGGQGDELAEAAIAKAIGHFSQLELTPKIRDCYQLGADYYRLVGLGDKADYFQLQADLLAPSN